MEIILTEKRNPNTVNIDLLDSKEIIKLINSEDYKVADAVEKEIDNIAKAVDIINSNFNKGGSLLYFGAGTSGRLGILDASECPPTFGVSPEMVRGYIAGGSKAIQAAIEGAEDNLEQGKKDLNSANVKQNDTVVAISASGNAPYLIGVLKQAKELNISTIGIVCNKKAKIKEYCDVLISPEVGEEVITGSTRMKAGTSQKMVLNMLTTASMVRLGKTYENYMIDLNPTNLKLKDRAARIISQIAECNHEIAKTTLEISNYKVKTSIIMIKGHFTKEEAEKILRKNNGRLRETLQSLNKY